MALLLSGPVAGQSGPSLVRDARLFDGETVVERSSVVVDAGRITSSLLSMWRKRSALGCNRSRC